MIHYYLITRDPGHDVEIQPFKPSASTLQKLTERPIFTGKRNDSKFPVFVVRANNRSDALAIYEDFIRVSPTRSDRLRKEQENN